MRERRAKDASVWYCPNPSCDGVVVKLIMRFMNDEKTGRRRYAGEFYGCPNFTSSGCDYAVSPDGRASGKTYRMFVLDEEDKP